jgi:hypothetical protein
LLQAEYVLKQTFKFIVNSSCPLIWAWSGCFGKGALVEEETGVTVPIGTVGSMCALQHADAIMRIWLEAKIAPLMPADAFISPPVSPSLFLTCSQSLAVVHNGYFDLQVMWLHPLNLCTAFLQPGHGFEVLRMVSSEASSSFCLRCWLRWSYCSHDSPACHGTWCVMQCLRLHSTQLKRGQSSLLICPEPHVVKKHQ